MLILVEGVDGVGKSSAVEILADSIRKAAPRDEVTVLHKGPPERSVLEEYELDIQWYRPGDQKHVICDRWHVGEDVYGPHFREHSKFDTATRTHVEKALEARGAVGWLLTETPEIIVGRQKARGDGHDLMDVQTVRSLQRGYWTQVAVADVDFWETRWGADGTDEAVFGILTEARKAELATISLSGFRSYIGPPKPRVLLLGDEKNPNGDSRWEAAFAPSSLGVSATFLFKCLPHEILKAGGIANASEENVSALYNVLGRPPVLTLGVKAHEECERLGIEHGAVPHPQYVRRFYHDYVLWYRGLIQEAAHLQENMLSWRPST